MASAAQTFWAELLLPDFGTFRQKMEEVLPPAIPVPGYGLLPRDLMIVQAWAEPWTATGVYARAYLAMSGTTSTRDTALAILNAITQSAASSPSGSLTFHGRTIMGQLIIANCYRIALRMVTGGRNVTNVFFLEGSASGQEAAAAAAALAGWKVASGPLAKLSSLIAMVDVTAMDISSSNGGIAVVTDTTAGGVSSTNSLATRGACALMKENGGTRSRTTRGRLYFGPIMEQNISADGATVDGTSLSGFNTAFTNFRSTASAAGFTLVVASRKTSVATSVTTMACESTIATQRRRIRS